MAPEHEGTILDPRVWNNPKLAYIYLLAERLVETFPEDSPEEDALRLAMSKIDEADMIVAVRASVGRNELASGC